MIHEGPRRTAKNGTATICPRRILRAAKNGNGNTFLSTKGHEGPRSTPLFIHEGYWATKNGNGNTFLSTKVHEGNCRTATAASFCPRRATKGHEERQRQHLCPRRTRRAAENGNCRTATATSFCPRRATKDREVHLYLSTKDTKGHEERQRQHLCPRRSRRAAENGNCRTATATSFCPRRATKDREVHLYLSTKGATKNGNGNTFVRGGRGGPRRTATAELQLQLLFVHEGPRRTAKYTSIYPRRITKGHEERQRQHLCPRRSRRAAENGICGRRRSWS